MNLRGIARLAVAAASTALLVGVLGAPARAAEEIPDLPFPTLNIKAPVLAADAANKGCAGIDDGTAKPDKDGWLFDKPDGKYTDLQYILAYAKDVNGTDAVALLLNDDGLFTLDIDMSDPGEAANLQQSLTATSSLQAIELPTKPAPAGFTGKTTEGGGWVKTPKGWVLGFGFALTDPLLEGGSFNLVRACPAEASTQPSASASASHPAGGSGGGQLPVTGSNVWVLSGVGVALVVAGAVLFMAYRRRRSVKFVA